MLLKYVQKSSKCLYLFNFYKNPFKDFTVLSEECLEDFKKINDGNASSAMMEKILRSVMQFIKIINSICV